MQLAHRTGAMAFAAILVAGCALVPLAEGPSASPFGDSTPPSSASASPEPTAAASLAAAQTAEPAPSSALVDLTSAAWFQWLHPEEDDETMSLYAGRLDGRAFKVIDSGAPITASGSPAGPVDGVVLTHWLDSDESVVTLVDTAEGTAEEIVRSKQRLASGAIAPDGTTIFWTALDEDGRVSGVWRRATSGGQAEKVLDGWDGPGPDVALSLDGKYIVFSNRSERSDGYSYRLFDADLEPVGQLLDNKYGEVVGFLDDRLIVYAEGVIGQELAFPLLSLDIHDWSAETIVSTEGIFAAIVPGADGTPRLLFDGHDADNRYKLSVLTADGRNRVVFVGEAPWYDARTTMMYPTTRGNVAAPGWVAVFPLGRAMTTATLTGGDQGDRRLIRISDGEMMQLPDLSLSR
jgi:hypothetical protein